MTKAGGDRKGIAVMWRVVLIVTFALNMPLALAAGNWATSEARPQGRSSAALLALLAATAAVGAGVALWRLTALRRRHWAILPLFLVPIAFAIAVSTSALPRWWPESAGGRPMFGKVMPGPIPADDAKLFELPGPNRLRLLGTDGMRVMIRPSFGELYYDIYLSPGGLKLTASPKVLVRVIYRQAARAREYQFDMPSEDLEMTLLAFDSRTRTWSGDGGSMDGTSVFVERVKDRKIISMHTNSEPSWSPNNPAAQLRSDLLGLMLAYGPSGIFPHSYDWHVVAEEHHERPCNGLDLNAPDADGFGVGDDDCAVFKRKAGGR